MIINKINLPTNLFKLYNSSVWTINFDMQHDIPRNRGNHPAPTSQEIYYRLAILLSNPSDTLYDNFCGSGTLSCVAKMIARHSYNVDVNDNYIQLAKSNCNALVNTYNTRHDFLCKDNRKVIFKPNSFDLIISSPPYYNSIHYDTNNHEDISNFSSLDDYLDNVSNSYLIALKGLKSEKYLAIIIGDGIENTNTNLSIKQYRYVSIHSKLINYLSDYITPISVIINSFGNYYNKTKKFFISKELYTDFHHEYILIFKNT